MTTIGVPIFVSFVRSKEKYHSEHKRRPSFAAVQKDKYSRRKWLDLVTEATTASIEAPTELQINEVNNLRRLAARKLAKNEMDETRQVLKRALTIVPFHADVLLDLARMEKNSGNLVEAEGLYSIILRHHKDNLAAHQEREAILEQVDREDNEVLRKIYSSLEEFHRNVRGSSSVFKEFATKQHIDSVYNSLAIEGNTMNYDEVCRVMVTGEQVSGKSQREYGEVIGYERALHNLVAHPLQLGSITVQDILDIHKQVIGEVRPEIAGVLRTHEEVRTSVGNHLPVSGDLVPSSMDALVEWLNKKETIELIDPVELAALAHYKFVTIHPFEDGNGRTARVLMNALLEIAGGLPAAIIRAEEKNEYFGILDDMSVNLVGDNRPFLRFIARQMERVLTESLTVARKHVPSQKESPLEKDVVELILKEEDLGEENLTSLSTAWQCFQEANQEDC